MEGTKIFPVTLKQYFECTPLMESLVNLPLALLVRGGGVERNKAIYLDQNFQCKPKEVQFLGS